MLLKRLYNHAAPLDDWVKRVEPCPACQGKGVVVNATADGVVPCPDACDRGQRPRAVPPLAGLRLLHTGVAAEQNFSVGLVTAGIEGGWISIDGDTLTLTTVEEALRYRIRRAPGRYCCHCQAQLPDDVAGALARLHVAQRHRGEASPDPANPAGYLMTNAYECELDAEQHARWRAR